MPESATLYFSMGNYSLVKVWFLNLITIYYAGRAIPSHLFSNWKNFEKSDSEDCNHKAG